MGRALDAVKAAALPLLRPFLRWAPSRFRPKARVERKAAGMGGARITPEMIAEEAEAKRELEEALARKSRAGRR